MSENLSETYTFDKPTNLHCTLTQNVKNNNKAISLMKQSVENNKTLQLSLIRVYQ